MADASLPRLLHDRLVRYEALVPGLNAFVDTRNPGSEAKENFTIIGPGVAENPDAHVHIRQPHGFNIGGARQPPGCINSQHAHETAEVFVLFSGRWAFTFGPDGRDARIEAGPGTILSVPTRLFRGFTNVGDAPGFLWVALGGDDPGRVMWAPAVFDMAERFGLRLLADGTLIDLHASPAALPAIALMPRTSDAEVAARPTPPVEVLERAFVRPDVALPGGGPLAGADVRDTLVIGPGAPIDWPHGLTLSRLELGGGPTAWHAHDQAEALFCLSGDVSIAVTGGTVALRPGDTLSMPRGARRRFDGSGTLIAVRSGDQPPAIRPA